MGEQAKCPICSKRLFDIDKGLSYCNRLFLIESKCKEMSPKERYDYRKKEATPVVDEYFAWVKSMEDKVLPKSKLGDAIIYSVRQEKYLRNYLLDGRLEISNNRAERSIKPFVIGRNYVFHKFMCRGKQSILQPLASRVRASA